MGLFGRQDGPDKARPERLRGGIGVRRGNAADEFATFEVMRRAVNYHIDWAHHAPTRRHLQASPRSSLWVAEETPRFGSPKIIGYARSIVRARVWCLTEFFLLPEHQRHGIGRALLTHCLEDGADAGVDTWFILASQHVGADSLYIRLAGCLPRLPMILLAGASENLRVSAEESATILDARAPASARRESTTLGNGMATPSDGLLRAYPLLLTPETQAEIDALDREGIGYARPQEHALWAAEMGGAQGASRLFRRIPAVGSGPLERSPLEGYAYIGAHSSGPALMREASDLPRVLAHVTSLQRANAPDMGGFGGATRPEQYFAVAGTNGVMLNWLLACGWQIVFQYLFMSSRPLGQLERYVCHNPLYFL